MSDRLTQEQRSRNMRAIRSLATKPERVVRQWLWRHGYRYRLNVKSVPGKPDIVMRPYRTAIFVNGCFWHAHRIPTGNILPDGSPEMRNCRDFVVPKTRTEWWQAKFAANVARDQRDRDILVANGWQVITLWQCQLTPALLEQTMQAAAVLLNENRIKSYKNKEQSSDRCNH